MSELVRCQFYRRLQDGSFIARGPEIDVISASGGWMLNRIGYGKLAAPVAAVRATGMAIEDLACVWVSDGTPTGSYRVAQFIVETIGLNSGVMDLSGPNYLGELNDFVVLDPIGTKQTVISEIESFRPHPDIDPLPYAAYGPRVYQSGFAHADVDYFNTLTPVNARVGDTMTMDLSTDLNPLPLFVTTVVRVSDGRTTLAFADSFPVDVAVGTQFTLYSTMINVADASVFYIGDEVRISANDLGYDPLYIGRIKNTEVIPNNSDYIEVENYFPITIPVGYYALGVNYEQISYTDVEDMLFTATDDQWRVVRSPISHPGTAYEPNGETVFQVMQALSERTGYVFRLNMDDASWLPRRKIDYFPIGSPTPTASATQLMTLGVANQIMQNYGEILELTTEQGRGGVTYLIPFGGGSGETRFTFAEADVFGILYSYTDGMGNNVFHLGHDGRVPYIIYRPRKERGYPPVWKVETFSNIYPENEASPTSRRQAANSLLVAACEWLLKNLHGEQKFNVTCHTVTDPRPGDIVTMLDYTGMEPSDVREFNLSIVEVHHEVNEPSGLRKTKLLLSRGLASPKDGAATMAATVRDVQRIQRSTSGLHRGSARLDYDSVSFRGDSTIQATSGTLDISTEDDDVRITSGEDVELRAIEFNVTANTTVMGQLQAQGGAELPDDDGDYWNTRYIIVRGRPRLLARG